MHRIIKKGRVTLSIALPTTREGLGIGGTEGAPGALRTDRRSKLGMGASEARIVGGAVLLAV